MPSKFDLFHIFNSVADHHASFQQHKAQGRNFTESPQAADGITKKLFGYPEVRYEDLSGPKVNL